MANWMDEVVWESPEAKQEKDRAWMDDVEWGEPEAEQPTQPSAEELDQIARYARTIGDTETARQASEAMYEFGYAERPEHGLGERAVDFMRGIPGQVYEANRQFGQALVEDEDASMGRQAFNVAKNMAIGVPRETAASLTNLGVGGIQVAGMSAAGVLERIEQAGLDVAYDNVVREAHEERYGIQSPEAYARELTRQGVRGAEREMMVDRYLENNAEIFNDPEYDPTAGVGPRDYAFDRIAERADSDPSDLSIGGRALRFSQEMFRDWAEMQIPEDHWAYRDNVVQRDFMQGLGSFGTFLSAYAAGRGTLGVTTAGGMGAYDFQQDALTALSKDEDGQPRELTEEDNETVMAATKVGVAAGTAQIAPIAVAFNRLKRPLEKLTGRKKFIRELGEAAIIGVQETVLEGFYEFAKNYTAGKFEYDPDRSHWDNVAHAATMGGAVGFTATIIMRGLMRGGGPMTAARRGYEDAAVRDDEGLAELVKAEDQAFEAYNKAEGVSDKARKFGAWKRAQQARKAAEEATRRRAGDEFGDRLADPGRDGTEPDAATETVDLKAQDREVTLDDVRRRQGVIDEAAPGEAVPDLAEATFEAVDLVDPEPTLGEPEAQPAPEWHDRVIAKAHENFEKFSKGGDRRHDDVQRAIEQNIGPEAAEAYGAEVERLVNEAVAQRMAADREEGATPDLAAATYRPIDDIRQMPPEPAEVATPDDMQLVHDSGIDPTTDTVVAETMRTTIDGRAASYGIILPANLQVDAETYQYKQTDDAMGRTDRFTGDEAWVPSDATGVIIHRREDGDFVADGHQRSGLARSRVEAGDDPASLNTVGIILNEADGWTAEDVRMLAALRNIRQETGTAIDAAKLLREGGDAVIEAMGDAINPERAMWRDAQGLARASDVVFRAAIDGEIQVDRAGIIGSEIADHAKQNAALQYMQENPPGTQYEARIIARDINRLQAQEQEQGGFDFGDAIAQVPIKERAKILNEARKQANTTKAMFNRLVSNQAMIEGSDAQNVLDPEGNARIAQNASTVTEVLNRLVDTSPELSEVLNHAANELAAGRTSAKQAARDLIETAQQLASTIQGGREAGPRDEGSPRAEESAQQPEPEVPSGVQPEAGEGAPGQREEVGGDLFAQPEPEATEAAQPEAEAAPETAERPTGTTAEAAATPEAQTTQPGADAQAKQDLAGESTPAARAAMQNLLDDPTAPTVQYEASGEGFLRVGDEPAFTPVPGRPGFEARQYVEAAGDQRTAVQEVRSPRGQIIRRRMTDEGVTSADLEGSGTVDEILSGRAFDEFTNFFETPDAPQITQQPATRPEQTPQEAPDATRTPTRTEARPERPEQPAAPEGGRADTGADGAVGGERPGPAGVRPPLRVASEERLPRPRVHVDGDSYQGGLDEHQQLAVNLALDRFQAGGAGFMLADGTGVGKTRQILALADQFERATGERVLVVTQNQQIIKGSFTADAQAMGINLGAIEMATYDSVRTGKNGKGQYGLVIFDEAHNLKNTDSAKTIAANNIKAKHRAFATATPMDRVTGAVYFISELTGRPESELYAEIGLKVVDRLNPETGKMETFVELAEGSQWPDIKRNLIQLRNEAIEIGAMVRREYPFYGEFATESANLSQMKQQEQSRIEDYWEQQISEAATPAARRNRAGQRLGELSRWVESQKIDAAYDLIQRKLAEGRSVIIIAEGVNPSFIKGLGAEVPGALRELSARLEAAGIPFAQIFGSGDKSGAVDRFQAGDVRVALATPKSGGTGINLDDVTGTRPRTLVTLTANYSGDTFEQILGRVSRRNTASPAEVVNLTSPESISDERRAVILKQKMEALRAIQVGEDLDAATIGDEPMLSRRAGEDGNGMQRDAAQAMVDEITADWHNAPPTIVVQSENQLPTDIQFAVLEYGAEGRVRGVFHRGQIYIVADNATSRMDVEKVLFHEVKGHYGLRLMMGEDLAPLLDQIWNNFGEAGLQQWIDTYFPGGRFDANNANHRRTVAEEKLASLAETNPQSRWVKRAIGALRDWLRRHNFMSLASLTEADLVHLMARAGEAVQMAPDAQRAGGMPHWAAQRRTAPERPTWRELGETLSGWRVQQLRDLIGAVEPQVDTAGMNRAQAEAHIRQQYLSFDGVLDVRIPPSAWQAMEGTRLSIADDQQSMFDDAPTDTQQQLQSRRQQVDERLRGREDVAPDEGAGDLFVDERFDVERTQQDMFGESKPDADGSDQGTLFSLVPRPENGDTVRPNVMKRALIGLLQVPRAGAAAATVANNTIERVLMTPFGVFGGFDRAGRWKPGVAGVERFEFVMKKWTPQSESLQWLGTGMNYFRAGLIDRWGRTKEHLERGRQAERERDAILMYMGSIIKNLEASGVDHRQAIALQEILEGRPVDDAVLNELAEPIRRSIDSLGQELVKLGLLDAQTWQKGIGKYLHRSYLAHEADLQGWNGLAFLGERIMKKRFQKAIVGDEFRARGIKQHVTQGRLQRNLPPEWWQRKIKKSGEPDKALKNTRWVVLEDVYAPGEANERLELADARDHHRVRRDRVYWPADEPIPSMYAGWENAGEFEVLSMSGQKITLRRDYTDAELADMGKVMDARFNIIKTFQLFAHDISQGRYFEDLAKSELSIKKGQEQPGEIVKKGSERMTSRTMMYVTADWVEVPTDTIAYDSKVKKWGALSGRLVRPEVWRELVQIDRASSPGPWRKLLNHWKLNKTARNPVVHMNNVMSNLILMDLQDVSPTDLVRAMIDFVEGNSNHMEAMEAGAYGGMYVHHEIMRSQLRPVMEQIRKEMRQSDQESPQGRARFIGNMLDTILTKVKAVDEGMINLYQIEDTIFRLATYNKYRGLGFGQGESATLAVDSFLNYDIQAPWINAAKNSVLPFISYTYRAVPAVAAALAYRPWKMAKYIMLSHLWNQFAYWYDEDGQEELERATMRDQVQGTTWMSIPGTDLGLQRMVRMPWRDQHGDPVFLDMMRWIPAGDIYDTSQTILGTPAWLQIGGPLQIAMEINMNKVAFTGGEIFDEGLAELEGGMLGNLARGRVTDKARSLADYAWKAYAPGALVVPGTWHFDKIVDAQRGARDRLGRSYSTPQAVAGGLGVKLQAHDVERGLDNRRRHHERMESAVLRLRRDAERDYAENRISQREHRTQIEAFDYRMKLLQEQRREFEEMVRRNR